MKPYPLCLRNVSKDFTTNNMKKKTGLNSYLYNFSVNYSISDVSYINNIYKYLMRKHDIK